MNDADIEIKAPTNLMSFYLNITLLSRLRRYKNYNKLSENKTSKTNNI